MKTKGICLIVAKLSDAAPSPALALFQGILKVPLAVQFVRRLEKARGGPDRGPAVFPARDFLAAV